VADAASQAETERARFAEESGRLRALADDAEARHAQIEAELADLRMSFDALGASAVMVPVDTLRLALAQFDHLAGSFARGGDIISQTICAIGTCTIEQAISGGSRRDRRNSVRRPTFTARTGIHVAQIRYSPPKGRLDQTDKGK
jgi:hypothetical protein